MNKPLVSVIIPNYNHEAFLEQRIESVLNQSYQNFEVIILDDCSTDNSILIISKYKKNPKVKEIIVNKYNSGSTFKQWDLGVNLAKGEYIWIAESDDFCSTFFLEKLMSKVEKDSSIGIIFSKSIIVDELGQETDFLGFKEYPNEEIDSIFSKNFKLNGDHFVNKLLVAQNSIPNASAVIFKKEIYISAITSPIKMKLYGDWFIWTKMLFSSTIYFYNESNLNFFRNHTKTVRNKETKSINTLFDHFELANMIVKMYPQTKEQFLDRLVFKYMTYFRSEIGIKNKLKIHSLFFKIDKLYFIHLFKVILKGKK